MVSPGCSDGRHDGQTRAAPEPVAKCKPADTPNHFTRRIFACSSCCSRRTRRKRLARSVSLAGMYFQSLFQTLAVGSFCLRSFVLLACCCGSASFSFCIANTSQLITHHRNKII